MIVRLDKWSKDPSIARFCERLLSLPGAEKKSTPQRCQITVNGHSLASAGLEGGKLVIEFRTGETEYAEAHGSSFVRPHPLQQMARDGWLQGRPDNDTDLESILIWIEAAV